jgi:hypothetical protein
MTHGMSPPWHLNCREHGRGCACENGNRTDRTRSRRGRRARRSRRHPARGSRAGLHLRRAAPTARWLCDRLEPRPAFGARGSGSAAGPEACGVNRFWTPQHLKLPLLSRAKHMVADSKRAEESSSAPPALPPRRALALSPGATPMPPPARADRPQFKGFSTRTHFRWERSRTSP